MKLSAVLLTLNEEKNIKKYIESIKELAKELVIVDGGSSDRTLQLAESYCKKYNIKLKKIISPLKNFSKLRMLGEENASAEYVICIDVDEILTKPLRNEIKKLLEENVLNNYDLFVAYGKIKIFIYIGKMKFVTESRYPSFVRKIKKHPSKVIIKKKSIKWIGKVHEKVESNENVYVLKNEIVSSSHIDAHKVRKYIRLEVEQSQSLLKILFRSLKETVKTIIRSIVLLNWKKYFLGSFIFTLISLCYSLSLPIFYLLSSIENKWGEVIKLWLKAE